MEVEFTQTASDYYNAFKHISRRVGASTKWKYLVITTGIACGVLIAFGADSISSFYEEYDYLDKRDLSIGLSAIAIGVVAFFASLKIFGRLTWSLIFEKNGLFLAPQVFRIDQEYLLNLVGDNQHQYLWKYVKEVEKTTEYIYVFLDRGAALYIPRHGFESDDEYNSFYEALCSHTQKSR